MKLDWLSRGGAVLALGCLCWSSGCGGDPPPQAPPVSRAATAPAPRQRMEAPYSDVAMLQRQPDGTFKRVCADPPAEMRAMLDAAHGRRQRP